MPRKTPINHYQRSPDFLNTKLYVIATEGYHTEFEYFTALINKYNDLFDERNLHLEVLRRTAQQHGSSSPQSTQQMLEEFLEDNQDYNFQADRDELWLIIDTDTWEKPAILQIAEKYQQETLYHLGLSNPCFELWLILHLADFNQDVRTYCATDKQKINAPQIKKCIDALENNNDSDFSIKNCLEMVQVNKRSQASKQLQNLINNHHHLSSSQELIDYIPQAISRAKMLGECDPNDDNYPKNLCTSVYKLLESLFQYKAQDPESHPTKES
jgi:hypothetical protein